ncbi:GNAT family N-acetyltransferase [Methanocella arvoryzae]|uniref:Predicted acetyltransferase (GNAT family) n=1 Tax=Methanocella arvoryzae (strain DSM 22066 / NBRC 105507 / MRE50) TaxID=351160 RepID=Q0W4Y3_METAR|nr:GNAT family N-acetyltransferase [Methanocella arvoryzae]CAJ36560.1 predicted acetyltransferase (GNAT family) [Methanocella arvoryzae MRE50]
MVLSPQGFTLETGSELTDAAERLLVESAARIPPTGEIDRRYVLSLPDRVRRGELGVVTLLKGREPIGIFCYRSVDLEAELVYGCLEPGSEGLERVFLLHILDVLSDQAVRAVRSGFSGPGADRFAVAAIDMGFRKVPRMSMTRSVDEAEIFLYKPDPGVNVLPWSTSYFEDVCRLMYEASEAFDRAVYPLFGSPEGCRTLLLSILQDRHGLFLPELSLVATIDDQVVGLLLSSQIADGSVLILDIAVDSSHRGKGIGGKMLENLISKSAMLGRRQIVLAVTLDNEPAIGLYRKMGFRQTSIFDQYVLELEE